MYMSTSSIKKVSAAAIAAVIGLSGMAHAAPVASPAPLPYYSNFSSTPSEYSNNEVYSNGSLIGQGAGSGPTGTKGWVYENGEADPSNSAVSAVVAGAATGNGTVSLHSDGTIGSTNSAPIWTDVENSNLADHPSAPGNGDGTILNSANYGGNVTVSFKLDVLGTGSLGANGTALSDFGARVLDSSDNLLAAVFLKGNPSIPGEVDVYSQSGTDLAAITPLVGAANGTTATYAIHLDFNKMDFQVFANGVQSADIPFGTGETGVTDIGGISFATDNLGTNTGVFSNFTVIPEPASFAMAGIGGLMLLAKRRRRQA
jgi:hypothetical protein